MDALEHNVQQIEILVSSLQDVIYGCTFDINDTTKVLKEWGKEWDTEEVKMAPKVVTEMLPFLTRITRSEFDDKTGDWPKLKEQAQERLVELCSTFYTTKELNSKMGGEELARIAALLRGWDQANSVLGMDEEEAEVMDAYYPNPLLALVDFHDCFLDELNDSFAETTGQARACRSLRERATACKTIRPAPHLPQPPILRARALVVSSMPKPHRLAHTGLPTWRAYLSPACPHAAVISPPRPPVHLRRWCVSSSSSRLSTSRC